ncbi:hypothetical protein K450DRAFT_222568 [Umbelopsis ramanniana AG]|uniref:Uncharacterized protein n=1 Tax=Umbelopsis ramanniana AG TaxID=1314678 RepID=A0AAD5HGQ6_UMBRA|nr:uncharacterized protein K450DRAFT_222568 [Umbelopsis ramanniana AG]KAI8583740.1 hypothetical protein K450DRAFT_222568 [Umbelopsis ramanniana AG]
MLLLSTQSTFCSYSADAMYSPGFIATVIRHTKSVYINASLNAAEDSFIVGLFFLFFTASILAINHCDNACTPQTRARRKIILCFMTLLYNP